MGLRVHGEGEVERGQLTMSNGDLRLPKSSLSPVRNDDWYGNSPVMRHEATRIGCCAREVARGGADRRGLTGRCAAQAYAQEAGVVDG